MTEQAGRSVTFQLSTSNVDDLVNVEESEEHVFTQRLNPSVQVPYYAKPQVALWSLSFANTIANIDKKVFDNDKVLFAYRSNFFADPRAAGYREEYNTLPLTIPQGNYNLSDLEFQLAKEIKKDKSAWDALNAMAKAMRVYFDPDMTKETIADAARKTVEISGVADPDIPAQWSSLGINQTPPLTFTELQGIASQAAIVASSGTPPAIIAGVIPAVHPELRPLEPNHNNAVTGSGPSAVYKPIDMTSTTKRYVKPITFRYNPQSNRLEVICLGSEIRQGSTLFTKTFGFNSTQLASSDTEHGDFARGNIEYFDDKSLIWDPLAGPALPDSTHFEGAWVTVGQQDHQPAADRYDGIMLPAKLLTFKRAEDPITGADAAAIDNARSLSFHLPGLASGSYDRDGNESGAQVASIPIRAAPGSTENWEVSTPLFMPCRVAGSEVTAIQWYVTNETGQRVSLLGGHMEATVVLKWGPPAGDAPPPSSLAARTDLERIIQPWANAMGNQPNTMSKS